MILTHYLDSRFDGKTTKKLDDSKFTHHGASLGSYKGRPFITGGFGNPSRKTEIFSTKSLGWELAPDYPYTYDDTGRNHG